MSRIGRKPIKIPDGVTAEIKDGQIMVKGPKGELFLKLKFFSEFDICIKDNQIVVSTKENTQQTRALWGLVRSLINNAVEGVKEGFKKELEIQGVGYRARVEGDELIIEIGFFNPVKIKKPAGIEFSVEKNIITVSGADKQLVGQIVAEIRDVKPPEPYKGKGIRYVGEKVSRKVGKRAIEKTP